MAMVIVIMLVPYHVISIAQYLGFVYFGVGSFTINLTDSFWPSLILAFTGLGIKEGLYIYLLREFFKSLPAELEEAAYIDGAGTIRTFFQVMLPNARTMMMTVFCSPSAGNGRIPPIPASILTKCRCSPTPSNPCTSGWVSTPTCWAPTSPATPPPC